ncbi:hypothetical protein PTKIN_Ptkin15bG0170900 [Pterospermum kingtungense]
MAKPTEFSIDLDPPPFSFFLHNPTVLNSFPQQQDNTQHPNTNTTTNNNNVVKANIPKYYTAPMDATTAKIRSPPPPPPLTIQFPVNLSSCSRHDQQQHHHHPCFPSDDDHHNDKRTIVSEMDFFAKNNKQLVDDDGGGGDDDEGDHHANHIHNSDTDHIKDSSDHRTVLGLINVNTGLNLLTTNTSSDQSMVDDGISSNMEDKRAKNELAVLQAELGRVNAENQRLREMLSQVTSNYNTVQMHLVTLMQQEHEGKAEKAEEQNQMMEEKLEQKKTNGGLIVPRQFMDLGLAAAAATTAADTDEPSLSSSEGRSQDRSGSPNNNNTEVASKEFGLRKRGNGEEDKGAGGREDSPDQGWSPNKGPRFNSSKNVDNQTEATMRKARVSVRARSEAPMITDGCQWRKYGQKMAKGNPCPRAYYRCTMAAGCPVRKQVQRCAEDRTILITTYEGNHNHPLPPAAMAMASTTSSAARMLLSGSMSSADGLMNSNFLTRTILPCSSSMATISASAPFPTVTLDLTQSPNPLQFPRPPGEFQVPFPNPPNNLANSSAATLLPQIFGQALYNQSKFSGLQMSQDMEQSQLGHQLQQGQQKSLSDTVNAATAAIAADPNFTAALAAAITSIIGTSHPNNIPNNTNNNGNNLPSATNSGGNVTTTSNSNSNGNNKISNSSFAAN